MLIMAGIITALMPIAGTATLLLEGIVYVLTNLNLNMC